MEEVKALEKLEKVQKILAQLREGWVLVEGKRDKIALVKLNCQNKNILTISGNLRISAQHLEEELRKDIDPDKKVFILTDLDRRGNQLANLAKEELESRSINANTMVRKQLGIILRIKYFEDLLRKYDKMIEECNGA